MELLTREPDPPPLVAATPLTLAELQRRVSSVEPAALLALPRIVRRVIKLDRDLTGLGLKVPHRKTYIVSRERLLQFVDPFELGIPWGANLPEHVLLIACPDSESLEENPSAALARTWRLLFHLRVHAALEHRLVSNRFTDSDLRDRIEQIGPTAFEEIRSVLRQEDFLLPPRDELGAYFEFAAVFLELKFFAPSLLESYFPAIESHTQVEQVLCLDLDAEALFRETRLEGASLPEDRSGPPEGHATEDSAPTPAAPRPQRIDVSRRLLRKAERMAAVGNVVRSAVLRYRAASQAPPREAEAARIEAGADIDRLVHRLQAALEIRQSDPRPWREALLDLLAHTSRGIWTPEVRLLYDLQKVCIDYERDIYTVDLVRWTLSAGREPIKRPLPSQREVLMSKHLHSAARRLAAVRIPESRRRQLAELLQSAAVRAEEQLRDRFRPLVAAALDDVGLKPASLPERVAQKKLVEELLDRVVDRGFLRMGDLRDALSRNNLKLPDLDGIGDFFRGDPLLRMDRRLGKLLDGVYERGEIYLRGMQTLSSLAFGTRIGRFLTRYVAIPFGGSYLALAGLQHIVEIVTGHHIERAVPGTVAANVIDTAHQAVHQLVHVKTTENVIALGLLFLLVLHVGWFRRAATGMLRIAGRVARRTLFDAPLWLYRRPVVQWLMRSRLFVLAMRFIVKPLLFTALAGLFVPLRQISLPTLVGSGIAVFLTMNLLLNSPLGRQVQEVLADWCVQVWHRFGLRIITGLFYLVMDVFRGIVEAIERLLYTVDEWLRFKSGESRLKLVSKAGLGVIWFVVTYIVRFCVNLLIEPQINPIKHFPVVTVGHKIVLPLSFTTSPTTIPSPLASLLLFVAPISVELANTICLAIVWLIPGIFGFLVWELKENWRLYASNRRMFLGPVPVGNHGETMSRLLKPGFHSGTAPKLFARLRRAERKARFSGDWKATRKHRLALRHLELAIRRFVQREFIELIEQSRAWQGPRIGLGTIEIASNRVLLELRCPELREDSLLLSLEQRSGWLVADIVRPGWFERLLPQQRRVLNSALLGLYKTGNVDLVSEQILHCLHTTDRLDFMEEGLLLRSRDHGESEVFYPLGQARSVPQIRHGRSTRTWPELPRPRLRFYDQQIPWSQWVSTWEQDAAGKGHPRELFTACCVVPEAAS